MRAAAARAASRGGNLSVRSAAALDAERRARWQTHEARWASFCRDDQASPLAAPFPASGEDLLLALQSVFLREDCDAWDGATRNTAADGTPTAARGAVVFGEDASAASPPSRASYRNVRRVDSGTASSRESRSTSICRTRAALRSRCRSVRDAPGRAVQLLSSRQPRARRPGAARTPPAPPPRGTASSRMSNALSLHRSLLFFASKKTIATP